MRLSSFHGWLLMIQFVIAAAFAIKEDWTWFAIATLGCFLIFAFGLEER